MDRLSGRLPEEAERGRRKNDKKMIIEKNDYYWKLLQIPVQEKKIVSVFETFRQNDFEPVLIKGWAAARNYPQPFERLSIDIDLAVNPQQFDACKKLLSEKNILGVDLHRGLRHLDTLGWDDLFAGTESVEIGGAKIRILRAEDHFRVLCVHWLNDGGAHKERLRDIYYALSNRPTDFDWDRCLNAVGDTRKKWIICVIALAEKYFGLDMTDTPLAGQMRDIPRWLIKTVESEWNSEIKLKPLENCLKDKREFYEQLKIRMPPNPIQATIEMEGNLDEKSRIPYQLGSILTRLKPLSKWIRRRFEAENRKARRAIRQARKTSG